MSTQIQYRKGTAAQNDAFTGALAEITVDTTNKTIRVHDGATTGGSNIATVAFVDNAIGALSANAIVNGNSTVDIDASGADITVDVGGTSNVAVFQPTGLIVTGSIEATNGFIGLDATAIANGTANVRTFDSANVTISAGGVANVGVFTSTGVVVPGTVSATGNVTGGNIAGTTGAFSIVTGNANATSLTSGTVPVARLTGSYTINISGSATTAGTVTTAAQPNITSVGTLSSLAVTGNTTSGNFIGTLNGSGANVTALNGTNISSGTVAAARIADLDAAKITTGIFADARIPNLDAAKITTGIFADARIPNLDAAKITTGIFAAARIPNLDAAKVTTGIFADARIPNLNASKITAGTLPVARGGTGVTTSTGTGAVVLGTSPSFVTQITVPAITKSGSNGVGNIGQSNNTFNTVFAKATSAQYADLAELYTADSVHLPGTVLVFGGAAEVAESSHSHSARIAGVVSTNPAHVMNSALTAEHTVAVALTGRAPCRVVGTIEPGDCLVSSDIPGTATVLDAARYQPGCVIGKALTQYNSTVPGIIEVVVGRL